MSYMFIEDAKSLLLYKRTLFHPVSEKDKRHGSAVFLMTPNYKSTSNLLLSSQVFNVKANIINFMSYYIEKNVMLFVNQENKLYIGDGDVVTESFDISAKYASSPVLFEKDHIQTESSILYLNEMVGSEVFTEVDKSFNSKLKNILYAERIKNHKEVIQLYDKIKTDIPFIKKTFTEYKMYKGLNLFVDWYYYMDVFFKNNSFRAERGLNLFLEFINRILADGRLEENGYHMKTVYIPVLDWIKDRENWWNYKNEISPLSIIYKLIKESPERLKEWGQYNFVFIGEERFFKVDFNTFEKKDLNKFMTNIQSIINKSPIEDDTIAGSESPNTIVANVVSNIELSSNIKIKKLKAGETVTADEEEISDDTIKAEDELLEKIDKVAKTSNDTEDAIQKIENDEDVKRLMLQLAASDDNNSSVKVSPTRVSRFNKINDEFEKKKIKNKTVSELLADSKKDEELPILELPIDSPNDSWKNLKYCNFNKKYNLEADITLILKHFSTVSRPFGVVDINIEDTSTSEDHIETYTVKCENLEGKRFTLKFDIPKFDDNRIMKLRGNEKSLQGQLILLPIIKTSDETVQFVSSSYNKIMISRYGNTNGKSFVTADLLLKSLSKYKGKNIVVEYGDNTNICKKYELPIDYEDVASTINKITYTQNGEKHEFLFNQDEIKKLIGDKYKPGDFTFYFYNGKPSLTQEIPTRVITMTLSSDPEFKAILDDCNTSSKYQYSKASILNSDIPLVVVMGYSEGLQKTLDKANVKYEIVTKRPKIDNITSDVIKFKDGYLVYDLDMNSSLLMNGLKECNTEDFSVADINSRAMWLDFLDIFGGRIKADGLDNFYDVMLDPITKEVCEKYSLPTDYVECLAYCNLMLSDTKYNKHSDLTGNRLRYNEIIASYLYKNLANAYGDYCSQVKRNRKEASISIKQSAVIDSIFDDATSGDLSVVNPLLEYETLNAVSFKGLSGLNSDRSYGLDKRVYDDSMVGVLAMSTGFAGNVGITRQATVDMNIDGKRGYIKTVDARNNDLSDAKMLCMTEAITPFTVTHDDPMRIAMNFIQTAKHGMRTKKSTPLLITNGADSALPYLTSDTFAFKAKAKGKIVEKNDMMMIVKYDNGETEFVDLREKVCKNSDAGMYVNIKLETDLKKGDTVKPMQIIAYDPISYSNKVGDPDELSYSPGLLVNVAMMTSDEGFEDSAVVDDYMVEMLTSEVTIEKEVVLPKNTNVFSIVKKGQKVEEGEALIIFQHAFDDEDANMLLKNISADEEEINEIGRIKVKSKITGVVSDIKILRTVETNELSPSLKKISNELERETKQIRSALSKYKIRADHKLDPDYKLDPRGRLKDAKDSVKIKFYLTYTDKVSIGDKIVYQSALKGVVKAIIPKGEEMYAVDDPDNPVHTIMSLGSINARKVSSVPKSMALNAVLIHMTNQAKAMMGLPTMKIDEMS